MNLEASTSNGGETGYPACMPSRALRALAVAVIVLAIVALSFALLWHVSSSDHALGVAGACLAILALAVGLIPAATRETHIPDAQALFVANGSGLAAFAPDRPPDDVQLLRC